MFKLFKKKQKDDIPLPPPNLLSTTPVSTTPQAPPQPKLVEAEEIPLIQPLEIHAQEEKQPPADTSIAEEPSIDISFTVQEPIKPQEPAGIKTPEAMPPPPTLPEPILPQPTFQQPTFQQPISKTDQTRHHPIKETPIPQAAEQPKSEKPTTPPLADDATAETIDFTLPDFEDEPEEEPSHLAELPELSEEDIPSMPVMPVKKMSIFIRAFDYSRIMAEKKRITLLISQTYRDTEEINRMNTEQKSLFEQWYGQLNSCQEKLMQIDNNLFEKYT
ncbi:MAG: hypothetical protein ABIJ21_03590 [Nanoarchaeota archaeon]